MKFWESFQTLYAVDKLEGYTDKDIEYIEQMFGELPQVLKDYYLAAGRTEVFQCGQDEWMLPEHFQKWEWLCNSDHLILLDENQGVCQAGIRREDLAQPDPPVYVTMDREEWQLCASTTSEFLKAALAYEAVWTLKYNEEEIFSLTDEELELLSERMEKQPFEMHNWIGDIDISIYCNAEDNVAAIMICGSEDEEYRDIQMIYGASSEEGYKKIQAALEDIGEPL